MFRFIRRQFSRVESYQADWCNIDRLNNIPLEHNERLMIQLRPNETVYQRIIVRKWDERGMDMGHTVWIPHSKASVKVDGCEILLEGLNAERIY